MYRRKHKNTKNIRCFAFIINLKQLNEQDQNKIKIMQFLLIAYDGTDPDAENRRLNVRQEHLGKIVNWKERGEFIFGGAILSNEGKMIGSMVLYEFPDRASLDERLKDEPYITQGVWQKIEIQPFRLAKI